jgi:hypothetical protein
VRFHGLRLGHHLAERERSRKNLDEDRVHRTDPFDQVQAPNVQMLDRVRPTTPLYVG